MRVTKNCTNTFYFHYGDYVEPLECDEPVLVVSDPSKQNMALLVGTLYKKKVIYEFSGKDDNDRAIDTVDYCMEIREFMTKLLCKCRILEFSQEEAIDKKGLQYFKSSLVLRDVRAFSIVTSLDLTGKKPYFINNWSWKSDILPDGYRSQKEKGSVRYLADFVDPVYATYSDDVTDVICMYLHRRKAWLKNSKIFCVKQEATNTEYKYFITDRSHVTNNMTEFRYNSKFSLIDNLNYFTNRAKGAGYATLDLSKVSPIEMVNHCLTKTCEFDPVVIVVS